jgi:RNA polymerase sigma-70 factor (ECF subfamily)
VAGPRTRDAIASGVMAGARPVSGLAEGDEAALTARLRAGDDDAFEELVRRMTPRLLAVAQRFLPTEEDARDAVQEAFLSAFRGLASFEGGSRLSTWLHRIVVNACLMRLRSGRRHPEVLLEDLLPSFLPDGHREDPRPAWSPPPADEALRRETRELVRAQIDKLPDDHRTVLLLRDIEELDTGETARVLGITEAAVKTRLHRARQALRTLLERELT